MWNLSNHRLAVRSTQYLVLSTQCAPTTARILLLVLLAAPGCQSSSNSEPTFDHQLHLVTSGKSDLVQVETEPLTDDHLARLADVKPVRILLIDSTSSHITAAGLRHLANLPNLEHLRIRSAKIDDAALAEIAKIKSLKILNVPQGEFTDAGLTQLKALPNLIQLRFKSPSVTDAGMQTLAELPALLRLHLIDVPITDAGLNTLAGIQQLESLYIDGGNFSDQALDDLFANRPSLHVHLNQQHHDRDPNKHP
jgi:hypothetical protein